MKVLLLVLLVAIGHAFPRSWELSLSPRVAISAAIAANTTNYVEDYEKLDRNAHCKPDYEKFEGPYMVYQKRLEEARSCPSKVLCGRCKDSMCMRTCCWNKHVLQNGQNAGLTQPETVAIYGWTDTDYKFINPIAWGAPSVTAWGFDQHPFPGAENYTCSFSKAEVWPYIQVLSSALRKLPPAEPVSTLWRGSRQSAKQLGNFISGGFTSTSHRFDTALNFAYLQGRSLWAIESHNTGKDIMNCSSVPNEDEVLFGPGSRFKVVECSPTTFSSVQQQELNKVIGELEQMGRKLDVICLKEASAASEVIAV